MYVNIFNEKLYPYNFLTTKSSEDFYINLKEYKDELDYWEFENISLKPIKHFLTENKIKDYPFIYTTAISDSWIDKGNFNFFLNGKHISEYDEITLKVLLFQGYIYICFKNNTKINSLLVLRTNLPASIQKFTGRINIENIGNKIRIPYNNNFTYSPNSNSGVCLTINEKYIIL